jgi:CBS domain-containing protein
MPPISFQGPSRGEQKKASNSQTVETNLASASSGTVQSIVDKKGNAVFSVSPSDTLQDAVNLLSEKKIGALVVTDDKGKLVGILSERDIVRKLAATPGQTLPQSVEENMTKTVKSCSLTDSIMSVLAWMTEGRFRHMPVLENGELVGIVTIGDVVHYRLNELEHEALALKQLVVG